jgi:hypothetical protein
MYFFNSNTGIIVGLGGAILKTTNGGISVGIQNTNIEVPKQYLLSQNYPNPFNPSTIITFEIPEDNLVRLIIYDIMGKEILVLMNEFKVKGKYQVTFNANSISGVISSGVYFYKISCEGRSSQFSSVKKMVFIK